MSIDDAVNARYKLRMIKLADTVTLEEETQAPRICAYGPPGVGKSTFAAGFPKPVFVQTERGMRGSAFKNIPRLPKCESWEYFIQQIQALLAQEHDYKTIVVDTINGAEKLSHADIAKESEVNDISDIGYYKGFKKAIGHMIVALNLLEEINIRRGCLILLLGHSETRRYDPPHGEAYDRYTLACHKDTAPLVFRWADAVFFAGYKTLTKSSGESFGQTKYKGISTERRLFTNEKPAFHAKNRYGLPDELPLQWSSLKDGMFGGN